MLQRLKRTVARVEVDQKPNGTAFLVDRRHVATALHVLAGLSSVDLVFVEWPEQDRRRRAKRTWRHPAGYDVAILELDRECPHDVQPVPWAAVVPGAGERWSTFGFPSQVLDGHVLFDESVTDPLRLVASWDVRVLQLNTQSAQYELGGFSGAPCAIRGAIVGIVTHQLRRQPPGDVERTVGEPSLDTLYALPIELLAPTGITPPMAEHDDAYQDVGELVRLAEALAGEAKASVLAAMLRAIDRSPWRDREVAPRRAAIARRLGDALRLVVHVVWRRENSHASQLAHAVYLRFTRSALAHTSPGLRIPTFLHDQPTFLSSEEVLPIDRARVEHTLIVVLRDDRMVLEEAWRDCLDRIVDLADGDSAATSVLPVELSTAKRVAPFDQRRMIHLTGEASPSQLLIALEERVLHVLARRSEPDGRRHVRLFLSYAKADGRHQADAIRGLANATPGIDALMDDAALAPGELFQKLEAMIDERVLVAFVTPHYTDRPWCRFELLTAKRLGWPVVVVNSQPPDLARAFPYLGNVPWVQWRSDTPRLHDIIEAASFEVLRDRYARLLLEDQTLLDEELQHAHIVTRPPELLDVVAGGSLAQVACATVLYPDPPIPDEELAVIHRAAGALRFVTPGKAVADAQPLRWPDGESLSIGLSASPADTHPPGVSELHFEDAWLDLARMLVLGGSTLVFGGDLRPGGLTDQLLELAEQRTALAPRGARRRAAPIVSRLAWPLYFDLTDEREAQLVDRVAFKRVPPPASTVATYPEVKVPPSTPGARYLWSLSMTRMRRTVLDDVTAMVVIGGRSIGYAGRYAGVVEEILLALRRGTPVFLLGGMGGAAAAVGQVLLGRTPTRLTSAYQLRADVAPAELAFVDHYNARISRDGGADEPTPIDHDAVLAFLRERGLAGLNNGLSDDENRLLLSSPSMHELSPVLLKGLRGLVARTKP